MTFERTINKIEADIDCKIIGAWPGANFDWDSIDFLLSDVNIGSKTVIEFFGDSWEKPTVLFSGTPFLIKDRQKGQYSIKEVVMKPVTVDKITYLFETYGVVNANTGIIIDVAYLDNLSGGEADFKYEMLSIFKNEMPYELKCLSTHLVKQEWANCASQIHKMKSKFRIMGMTTECELANEIELAFKAEEVDSDLHAKIQHLFAQTKLAIKEVSNLIDKEI